MIDLLLQFGFSNLCICLIIACFAWLIQRTGRRPFVAHFLWLFVLLKLLTPALITVPIFSAPSSSAGVTFPDRSMTELSAVAAEALPDGGALAFVALQQDGAPKVSAELIKLTLVSLWFLGSVGVLLWTLFQSYRFHRLVMMSSELAPKKVQECAATLAEKLGLGRRVPKVYVSAARMSPLLWWIGGPVRIFVPAELMASVSEDSLKWILAHELGHLKRRDHLSRWLEWFAAVCLWWNPLVWLARRNLRVNEEICCDALVLSCLKPQPQQYAGSLLAVIEFLASPALRPPALASGMNSGGILERRFTMIVSNNPLVKAPRWLPVLALLLLPLGVAVAQEPDYEAVGTRLLKAVERGELSASQAKSMMGELARARFGERLQALARKHHGGEKHHEGHDKGSDDLRAHFHKLGLNDQRIERIVVALKKLGLREHQVHGALEGMVKVLYGLVEGEKDFAWFTDHLRELGLNGEQTRVVWGLTKRVAKPLTAPKKGRADKKGKGRDSDALKRRYSAFEKKIRAAVKAGKMSRREAGRQLEAARKKLFGQDEEHRRSDRKKEGGMADHFRSLGVSGESFERIHDIYKNKGFAGKKLESALGITLRLVHAGKNKDEEARAKITNYMTTKMDFSKEQVQLIQRVAKRLLMGVNRGQGKESKQEGLKKRYAAIEKEIREAVKAGKMSRRDAARKLSELRGRMFKDGDKRDSRGRDKERDKRSDKDRRKEQLKEKYKAIEKEIREAVKAGKMSRRDAARKLSELRGRMFKDGDKRDSRGRDKKRSERRSRERRRPAY
jgi:beta-lactamase regulating signal transducer with metallopeptidase domain